jgi:sugar O-acyltransferase (sialic acid O-acetyltransferase NeuD family)
MPRIVVFIANLIPSQTKCTKRVRRLTKTQDGIQTTLDGRQTSNCGVRVTLEKYARLELGKKDVQTEHNSKSPEHRRISDMNQKERVMIPTVIVGCGGHGRVIADILRACGQPPAGFLDDGSTSQFVDGVTVIGSSSLLDDNSFLLEHSIIVGIGDAAVRRRLARRVLASGGQLGRAIHPHAVLAGDVTVGDGSVVMAGAIINIGSRIGRFAVVNTGAILDHDNVVEDGAQIAPGCCLAGCVWSCADAFVGTGASVIPRITVGARAVVGAGSAVIRDVEADTMVAGCPAVLKRRLV